MKFGDKLIQLRKKKGLSQEELAEKLKVSRQSVSKWESNNTYPETDKIVQICNLFDCSMDDLINDKITDVEQTMRKNKNNLNEVYDSILDFLTKTINMFSKMNFSSGLRCVIEMLILLFILWVGGKIVGSIFSSVMQSIFQFLSYSTVHVIGSVSRGITYFLWMILSFIVVVHTFKIRYLDYYDSIPFRTENVNSFEDEKKEVLKEPSKVIIRDPENKPFAFLGVCSKIVIWCIKFFAFWFLLGIGFIGIGWIVLDVLDLSFITLNTIFLWFFFITLAGTIFTFQLFYLLFSFIFHKKVHGKIHFFIFIACILLCGVGIGLSILEVHKFEVVSSFDDILKVSSVEKVVSYSDNLVIENNTFSHWNSYDYVIDDSLEEDQISISKDIYSDLFQLSVDSYYQEDDLNVLNVSEEFNGDIHFILSIIKKDLKNNRIHILKDSYESSNLVVRANQQTIQKLLDNLKKLYLIDEKVDGNVIHVEVKESKVFFPNGVRGHYSAIHDEVILYDEDYECFRSIKETPYGDRIIYSCNWIEEEE